MHQITPNAFGPAQWFGGLSPRYGVISGGPVAELVALAKSRAGSALDVAAFKTWVKSVLAADPTACDGDAANSLGTLIQPSSSTTLTFSSRAATAGDVGKKQYVYFADGTTGETALTSTSADTVVANKTYSSGAQRYVFWLGLHRSQRFVSGDGSGGSNFGGQVSWMLATQTTYCSITGSNTVSGPLPSGLTYCNVQGSNTVSGTLPAGLTYCDVRGSNTVSGTLPAGLTFCNITGSNTVSGTLPSGLTFCVLTGSNTVSGTLNAALQYYYNTSAASSVTYNSAAAGLCYYKTAQLLTTSEVNAILAGFWANRDAAKPRGERVIDLDDNAGSGAPSGQGIIDKAALQAYRSPNNDPTKALWTVTTK